MCKSAKTASALLPFLPHHGAPLTTLKRRRSDTQISQDCSHLSAYLCGNSSQGGVFVRTRGKEINLYATICSFS
ncbi:hypothetical protein L596_001630 [Steinernema carpocapsae]|uniref:Uncharacterized protein n=1 Tax=Steinernema carpocapsae TaxID=34508 RepID=A0A4U8UM12_STECR|nr:hypothetical protein L596_001630 [Steinernema carpocapsae]